MKALEFLKKLHENRDIFNIGISDFDILLKHFTPTVFDNNLKEIYGKDAVQFLKDLENEFLNANPEEVIFFIDYIFKHQNLEKGEILLTLRDLSQKYIINHLEYFDIKKYYNPIVLALFNDLKKDLNYQVSLKIGINSDNNDTQASALSIISPDTKYHIIDFYTNFLKSNPNKKELMIFYIFFNLCHEQYHCLGRELDDNPTCFKKDILRWSQITVLNSAKGILFDGKKSYLRNYNIDKEEMAANLYAFKQAIKRIKAINPDFDFKKILAEVTNANPHLSESNKYLDVMFLGIFKFTNEEDFLDKTLDKLLPTRQDLITGTLSHVYHQDGSRKDVEILLKERDLYMTQYKDNPELQTDIIDFYNHLLYRIIRKKNIEELSLIMQDKETSVVIENVIIAQQNEINFILQEFKNTKSDFIVLEALSKKSYLKELKRCNQILTSIQEINQKQSREEKYGL